MSEHSDIEMAFVRTLSVNGLILSGGLSKDEVRERIRTAIFQQKLVMATFDQGLTFAQAFLRCYNRPLEMRRVERDVNQRPVDVPIPDEDDIEDRLFQRTA